THEDAIADARLSMVPDKLNTTSNSKTLSGTAMPSRGSVSETSASKHSSKITRPAPPASTTPALRKTSNCDGVLAKALAASSQVVVSTSTKTWVWLRACSAACAAALSTETTVPSTGSAIARSTNSTASFKESTSVRASMCESAVESATARSTCDNTMPELP